MHGYGMMGDGGWMFFWWIGGLFLFGAVIYAAVRPGTLHPHRDDYSHYDRDPYRSDFRRYYQSDDRYRGDGR